MAASDPVIDITADLIESFRAIGTCTATALLQQQGLRNTFVMGLGSLAPPPGGVMVGRAVTLRFIPLRETLTNDALASSPHRQALERIGPGEVLVIDTGGTLEAAVVGDIFTRRILQRGGHGLVIDGVVRDLGAIRQLGLPVYGKGVHGAGISRALMSVGLNEPICCGGVPVLPGDVVVGDEDGVVVMPPEAVPAVLTAGLHKAELEEFIRERVAAGASLHTHYPPNEAILAEFETWRAARAGAR
jgi:regulator of RNase E activity RraA